MLRRTPFYDFHIAAGAKMVDFAGWEMPLMYRSIIDEHQHTRTKASIFDVSHMGRLRFAGPDATQLLNKVLTRNVAQMHVSQCRYSLACNEAGGVLDDVIVSRDNSHWLVVCNAGNREKLLRHLAQVRRDAGMNADVSDQTEATAMVAIQGPLAVDKIADVLPVNVRALKRYTFASGSVMLIRFMVFRSGYTGEDGVELILPARAASMVMTMLGGKLDKPDATIRPAGLGARDTLRLEAAMPLYGHELSESIDPVSAGLAWAVDLGKDFIGADALRVIHEKGPARRLVGLELQGLRIARQGAAVFSGQQMVGQVTSGTLSPTLGKSIALAYVDVGLCADGTELQVDLKAATSAAKVVPLPFYKRS